MNRRIIITLLLLLLLILLLVGEANLWPPRRLAVGPKKARRRASLRDSKLPLDEGFAAPPETEAESLSEEPKPIVVMVHHSGWRHNGYYEVFGELENTGQLTAYQVSLHVIFKSIDFQTITTVNAPADKTTLRPGRSTTFKVVLKSKSYSNLVTSYVVLPQIKR